MYKVTYRPDLTISQVVATKEFDSYKSALYFANKFQADGLVLEIKWYPKDKDESSNHN
jgi:hypothetical protein